MRRRRSEDGKEKVSYYHFLPLVVGESFRLAGVALPSGRLAGGKELKKKKENKQSKIYFLRFFCCFC